MECGCPEFLEDDASELFDRLKGFILKEPEELEFSEEPEIAPEILSIKAAQHEYTIFLGKVSRECSYCGEIKLYKDFNNSHDPEALCNYCAWEVAGTQELEDLEDQIIENEMAYEEALERQEMIDMVLRELDE